MATLAALIWVSGVAILFAVSGGNISVVGFLAIGPFIAALYARPWRVALVGLLAAFFALVIGTPPHNYGELNHILRVLTQLAATGVAMYMAYLRVSGTCSSPRLARRRGTSVAGGSPRRPLNGCRPWHGP